MASPSSSNRAENVHGIQFDDDDDCIVKHDIRFTHNFGEDGYSSVLRDTLDGQRVAIKRIEVTKGTDQPIDEFKVLQQLNHPNVVKLLHCKHEHNFMCYAFERCDASLAQLFLKSDDPKKYDGPMPHHIDASLQLAAGLEHIHSHNLVHGDIKPENVLISVGSGGKDEITLKWANFGLNRNVSERGRGKTNQVGGNNTWLAPELLSLKLNNVEENNCKDNAKSDVFAEGLVFGSLFLNGEHLFGSIEKENEILQNIIEGNPINVEKIDCKLRNCYENELLKKMLEHDPDKRITSTQVVNQLKAIKDKIAGKEKELLELCGRDSRSDLTEKIQKLIQFGINLNAKDDGGSNALHLLCRYYSSPNFTDAIKLLIENKIDVNAKDDDGLNAIHFLCRYSSNENLIKAIQILIESGIDAKATANDGSNALHYLCRYNSSRNLTDATKILTKLGLDLMAEDNDGWSAFYYLQSKDKKEMKIWFDRDAVLGQGYFGTVIKGKFGGREVAVKRVQLHRVDTREEQAMLKLDHPNIVKLLHCEKDNDFMYYALELCDGSLDRLLPKSNDPKKRHGPIPHLIHVLLQLASGLAYIHSKNFIHRDIKPYNILIMQSPGKNEEIILKWSDFGYAKSVNEKGLHSWSGVRGTRTWYAPEVLKKLLNGEKAENEEEEFWGTVKSDVFVLGLVFGYLFLEGEHLYGSKENEIHENIIGKNPVNMQKINEKLRRFYGNDLLRKMLEDDPDKRITSNEVVKQLKSIKNKLTKKEEGLRRLCANDSSSRLTKKINDLIQLGIDVNAKDDYGKNALHHLCWNNLNSNLIDAIRLLIQLGINVNATDWKKRNALHYLCQNDSNSNLIDAIRLLIQLGIDVNAKNEAGCNALHCLCQNKSNPNLIDAIRLLIQLGIDVKAKDEAGCNALHYLCRFNSEPILIDAIQLLIDKGIDVNAKNEAGCNALHYLCLNNSNSNLNDAIQLLTQLGIDVNAKDKYGENALHHLCRFNSNSNLIDAIRLLTQLGIDVNAKNNNGKNAFNLLCRWNSSSNLIDAIRLLIQLGIDVNAKVKYGQNALHYLCRLNSNSNLIDGIQPLIQEGIDVNATDEYGRNALHYLCRKNSNSNLFKEILLLIRLGIDVNAKDDDGWNALHYLCLNNSNSNLNDAIGVLIELGINVNAKSKSGRNALHILCDNKSNSNLIYEIHLLIGGGIDVNAKDEDGLNALHHLCLFNSNSNLIDGIQTLIQEGIPVVSDGNDARSFLRKNDKIENKEEILKLLDEAARV